MARRRERQSLKNKFEDISVDEPLKVEIEGREMELDVFASDISTFMKVGETEGTPSGEVLDDLEKTLRNILQRSYLPYYNMAADREMDDLTQAQEEEQEEERRYIEGLLTRYYIDIFTGVTQALGWHDGDIDPTGLEDGKKKLSQDMKEEKR